MRHYPALPGGYAIFADDIRQELGGKITLVGTYSTELIARGTPPFLLPQFCMMIVFRDDPDALPKDVTLRVLRLGSDKEEVLWDQEVHLPKPEEHQLAPKPANDPHFRRMVELLAFPRFIPFTFTEECRIAVRAYVGKDEIRIASLLVKIEPPATDEAEQATSV